jgi:hypothetical protein
MIKALYKFKYPVTILGFVGSGKDAVKSFG